MSPINITDNIAFLDAFSLGAIVPVFSEGWYNVVQFTKKMLEGSLRVKKQ